MILSLIIINFQTHLQTKFQHHTAVNTHFIKPLINVIFNVIIGQQSISSKLSFSVCGLHLLWMFVSHVPIITTESRLCPLMSAVPHDSHEIILHYTAYHSTTLHYPFSFLFVT